MPFIGNQPALSYTSFVKQDFTTSATTSYTLSQPVTNANELALFINFVRQEPTTAYTASGTTLTLTSATTASDDMYCIFLGKALQTINPPAGSVGINQLTATGTKDATTFLRGDNTFASAGGTNTPNFSAYLSTSTSLTSAVFTKVQFDTKTYDTGNCYDNTTNYRFTPNVAGKYHITATIFIAASSPDIQEFTLYMYKNGSQVGRFDLDRRTSGNGYNQSLTLSHNLEANGTTDYFEIYTVRVGGGTVNLNGDASKNYFTAFKIIE